MSRLEVKAEITGSVWKMQVQIGDRVQEEDVLLIMESMKMEIPLMAPAEGVVKEIAVKEGDGISEGAIAVVLECT